MSPRGGGRGAGGLPPLVIFDADGTLRWTTVAGKPCPDRPGEWRLFPDVRERLRAIDWGPAGHRLGIASNQNGVALGYLTGTMALRLLRDMVQEALGFVPGYAAIEMCVCPPARRCACRKPGPAMLLRILERFGLPPSDALFVGDLEIDRLAAQRAGVAFEWAHDFFGRRP